MKYLQKFVDAGWNNINIAKMLEVDKSTVGRWLADPTEKRFRKMPTMAKSLLRIYWKYPRIRNMELDI